MKKPLELNTPKDININMGTVVRGAVLMLVVICLLFPYGAGAGSPGETNRELPCADGKCLEGKWLRPDGGYLLELKGVKPPGRVQAAYFNPKRINVGKSEWRGAEGQIQVFVELRDVNYPGSTYTLAYFPQDDTIRGYYYQAVHKQTFCVVFVRAK